MTPDRRTRSTRHGRQETVGRPIHLSRRQRRALDRLEQDVAADAGLRRWCEYFPDTPSRDGRATTTSIPVGDVVVPAVFAALMLTGTVLTALAPALHASAVAMTGLALFLLAPVCVLVAAAHARRGTRRALPSSSSRRCRPRRGQAAGRDVPGWLWSGMGGGMWLQS